MERQTVDILRTFASNGVQFEGKITKDIVYRLLIIWKS